MASLFSLQIPFCILSGKSIVQGTAIGSVLLPYQIYEIRCASGEIFNIEAVPTDKGIHWSTFGNKELAGAIGLEIEKYFKKLKAKSKKQAYSI
jgi:acetylornithine/succinyldiaminopimelate/putrescine aminotransferase